MYMYIKIHFLPSNDGISFLLSFLLKAFYKDKIDNSDDSTYYVNIDINHYIIKVVELQNFKCILPVHIYTQ